MSLQNVVEKKYEVAEIESISIVLIVLTTRYFNTGYSKLLRFFSVLLFIKC